MVAYCSIENYDFTQAVTLDRSTFMRFVDGSAVDAGENSFLYGGAGTGKTHLCIGLAAKVAALGKTVRLFNGESGERLREDLDISRIGTISSQEAARYPMMRPDLLHCDLLIVNELQRSPIDHDDYGYLGNLVASRYKAGRSTFIATIRTPTEIVRCELLNDRVRNGRGIGTARLLVDLNIGYVLQHGSYPEFRDLIDDDTPYTTAHQALLALNMLKPSWLSKGIRDRLGVQPGKEWHLLHMTQKSYRLVQRERQQPEEQSPTSKSFSL